MEILDEIKKELENALNLKSSPTKHTEYKIKYQRLKQDIKKVIEQLEEKKMMICHKCEGKGRIPSILADPPSDVICPLCLGKKVVKRFIERE